MGMHADDYLNDTIDEECVRLDFIEGRMNIIDAYDRGIVDEHGALHGPYPAKFQKVCRFCGKGGLHWAMLDGKWRLYDNGHVHVCSDYRR